MRRRTFLRLAPATGLLAACGGSSAIRLALNWKPDPQFGGFYAADYGAHGLEVEILPGGASTPTVQMIGAGSAEFGIVSADEIVVARSRGNDVVALFAVFQTCPQGIMVHASRGLTSIGEVVKEGTLAMSSGLPYARLLKEKYGFDHVRVVPSPGGDVTAFLNDPLFAQQCFVMSEPLVARSKGADVQVFPVADLGYNPYTTVLATRDQMLLDNLEEAKSMVAAVREGWRRYLDNPKPTDERMHGLNPSMDPASFAAVAEAQRPFIETDETKRSGLGVMTRERWATLARQLAELGDIPKAPPADECFRQL